MKKVLYISFDYPPNTSPGALRTKVFCQTLRKNNIEPIVLSSREIENKSEREPRDNDAITVERVRSIDALKLLSFRGRSLSWFALPDRWWPWIISGFRKGSSIIKANKISLIVVTIPTYSAAVMSLLLAKKSGLPLIVDLRDPFRFRYDPENVPAHFLFKYLESSLIRRAEKVITTTKECGEYYSELYSEIDKSKFLNVGNGFDEESFIALKPVRNRKKSKFTLLHSGTLYSIGRNPEALLIAISLLKEKGIISSANFQLVVRGSSPWPSLKNFIKELSIENLVIFKGKTTYHDSLIEMNEASALVIIQGGMFNIQVPSKIYDYLASKKPILVMSNPEGATGMEAKRVGLQGVSETPEVLAVMLDKIIKGKGTIVTDFSQESRQIKSVKAAHVILQVLEKYHGS